MITTDFLNNLQKDLTDSFAQYSTEANDMSSYNRLFEVWDTDEYTEIFTSFQWFDNPTYIDEAEEIKQWKREEWYKTSIEAKEFAIANTITKKFRIKAKDDTTKLSKIANTNMETQLLSMNNFIETETHSMLNNAFTTALAPDWNPIIWSHSWWPKTTATFNNQITWNLDLDTDAVDFLQAYAWNFEDAQGKKMPLNFDTLYLKKWGSAHIAAMKLFAPKWTIVPTTVWEINIYEWEFTIVATPYLTSSTAYFFYDSSKMNPLFVNFNQRPSLEDREVNAKNADWIYNAIWSFKFWVRDLPYAYLWSDGTNI